MNSFVYTFKRPTIINLPNSLNIYWSGLKICGLFILFLLSTKVDGQEIVSKEIWQPTDITANHYQQLLDEYGKNKTLPKGYEKQALIALSHYPELKDTRIVFKIRKRGGAPFASRPTPWSLLFRKPKKRKYRILISQKTKPVLNPILMKHLSFNAQIGVMGHELAHTSFYLQKKVGAMMKIAVSTFSARYLDKFEYQTDEIAIAHGLGFQLLSWSQQTHAALGQEAKFNSNGPFDKLFVQERYMRPATIREQMKALDDN